MKNKSKKIVIFVAAGIVIGTIFLWPRSIYLKPSQNYYPIGVTSITATFQNIWPHQYRTSHAYVLEQLAGDEWEKVQKDERGAFFDDDGFFPVHGTKIVFDLTKYSNGLTKGIYQIRMILYNNSDEKVDVVCKF